MVKSFKTLSQNWTEEEYRTYPAIHYSALAQYAREGFGAIGHFDEPKESDALTFGSIVDTLLTDSDNFESKFAICTVEQPAPAIKGICEALFELADKKFPSLDNVPDELLLELSKDAYTNYKPETKLNKIKNEGNSYYSFLVETAGKKVITENMLIDAERCVAILQNSPTTSSLFNSAIVNNPFKETDEEILYQSKFLYSYDGKPIKIMVDVIHIDHDKKTIQPYDLKTTGQPEYKFFNSVIKWNYDIQADLYEYVLKKLANEDEVFKEYTILPFKFIVVNKETLSPMIWEWDLSKFIITEEVYRKLGFHNWKELIVKLKIEETRSLPVGLSFEKTNGIIITLVDDKRSRGDDIDISTP